jgi:hypothetical protein
MFKGDIANFSPADLLLFLSHLGKEGVLTVSRGDETLSFSFKDGRLVDAHSDQADGKTLQALHYRQQIDDAQFEHINRARKETGLPLAQILENLDLLSLPEVPASMDVGVHEVLFQLFMWEAGQFQFAEIAVDQRDQQCITIARTWRSTSRGRWTNTAK